jgi:hypothetical protein
VPRALLGGDLEGAWRLGHESWPLLLVLHRKPIMPKEFGASFVKYAWPFRRAPANYHNLSGLLSLLRCRVPLAGVEVALSKVESILRCPGQALCLRMPW